MLDPEHDGKMAKWRNEMRNTKIDQEMKQAEYTPFFCQDGGSHHTFDEYDICFECGEPKPKTKPKPTAKQLSEDTLEVLSVESSALLSRIKLQREKFTVAVRLCNGLAQGRRFMEKDPLAEWLCVDEEPALLWTMLCNAGFIDLVMHQGKMYARGK